MLHHLSIAVANPGRVARVFAELMNGRFFEFPVHPGAYIAMAGDANGTAIEILPDTAVWIPGAVEVEVGETDEKPRFHSVHAALSVPVSRETIERIGAREGWLVRYCDRGPFQLVEFWVENVLLVELITRDTLDRYLDFMRFDVYASFLHSVTSEVS